MKDVSSVNFIANLTHLGRQNLQELPPSDWPVRLSVGRFLGCSLVEKGSVHTRWTTHGQIDLSCIKSGLSSCESHLSWISVATTPHQRSLFFSANGDHQRKPITGHSAEFNWSWGAHLQWMHLHHSSCLYGSGYTAKGTSQEKLRNDCKSQNTRKSALKMVCISKTRTMAISMSMLCGRRKSPWDPFDKGLWVPNDYWEKENSFLGMSLLLVV